MAETVTEPNDSGDIVKFGGYKVVEPYVNKDSFDVDLTKVSFSTRALSDRSDKLQKAFTGLEGAGTKAGHEKQRYINAYDLFEVAHPMYNLDYLMGIYDENDTHYAAIQAKVANIVGLGYDFIESPKTMEREDKIDDDTERIQKFRANLSRAKRQLLSMIDDLNKEDEFIETLEKVVTDYEVSGNGYLEIGRTKSGSIGYIGHVPFKDMRVRLRRDGFVQFVDQKPVFFRRFGDTKTRNPLGGDSRPNEIIHFKKYNPRDHYYGSPDIIPAMRAVAGNKFADEYNLDFFENKAVPRNIIIVRGGEFDEAAQRKLLRFFGQDLRGSHHRALYVPLPADSSDAKHDIEIRSVETGLQDSAFKNYSEHNTNKILMVHRVPASKLGMTGNSALAAAKDLDKTFKEQVCRPTQRVFEKKINRVIAEMTDIFLLKLNELDLVDEVSQSAIDTAEHAMGAITPNEIRARKGRSGLKGGDRTIFDVNEEAAEKAANVQAKQAAKQRSEAKTAGTNGSRARTTTRATARTDSVGAARNAKGEGRSYS